MTGATMNPVQLNRSVNTSTGESQSPFYVNFLCISATVDRLRAHVRGDNSNRNNDFCNLCLYLSRGIDYAVANNEIPDRASDLPQLIKQVCQWANDDTQLHAGIMVLMISLKGACRNGWFSEKDNGEIHILRNELAAIFSSVRDMNSEESTLHHSISAVMSRFYPGMKMGEILTFVESMPGFGAFVKDFFIPNNAKSSGDKIYLFDAQTDNTETSSCIISPQHAKYKFTFLLNGKAVDRTCGHKDSGPQIPTLVTHMVKYGTNILQVLGQFKGKCVIVVAYMSLVSNPSFTALPDYVPPTAAASHSENNIIEGPSRISLNCPISFRRIKTPVKGYLCKHLQCFDFDNYVCINSRRPSWRCPHCGRSVCFTDIRIDQTMVKILEEVGVNAIHVKISADGSWETVNEGDVHTDKQQDKPTLPHESTTTLNVGAPIMDSMEGGNMDASNSHLENDRKPSPSGLQNVNLNKVHRSTASHMENQFQRTNLQTHDNWTFNTTSHVTENVISQSQSQPFAANSLQLPIHAIGSSNTKSNVTMTAPVTDTFVNANSQRRSQTCASNDTPSQQHNSNNMSNGYGGRHPTPPRLVKRILVAIQALPVQTSTGMVSGDRQQQFSMFHMDQHEIMRMIAASSSMSMGPQGWVRQDRSHVSSQPFQQFGAHAGPPKKLNVYRHTTTRPLDEFNSHQHQSLNQLIPDSVLSAGQFSPQIRQGVVGPTNGLASNQEAHHYMNAAAQQATQNTSWTPPVPSRLHTSGSAVPKVSLEQQRDQGQRVLEVSANSPVVDPWQPTVRMRGGLSGQAYSDAMNQFMFHPIQPMQATRPPVLNTPRPVIPPHLQVLMDYNRNAHNYQYNASGSMLDGGSDGSGGGVLPYI